MSIYNVLLPDGRRLQLRTLFEEIGESPKGVIEECAYCQGGTEAGAIFSYSIVDSEEINVED